MKKKIQFDEIKQFFVDLADGKNKKIQIEQIVINEMIFVDKSTNGNQFKFFYEFITFTGMATTWIAIGLVCYSLFFNI